jgi:serine/threonine-protein kinase
MLDPPERLNLALADRYAIERELGSGGMATVYLAQDLKHSRQVALKVLKPELAHAVGADRFLREIRITAGLNHPHILPLLDSGEADGFLYFVMPYVAGESLRARLDREGPLPIDEALRIAEQVASALEHAHRQEVIHRDVKPENILLHEGVAMVADFGIAVAVSAAGGERLTETGIAVGTPAFMSPEQASGDENVDERSDIYSLGCVLYEMLGGEAPHGGASPREILAQKVLGEARSIRELRPEADAALEAVLARALEAAPEDRFTTAAEFAQALRSPEVGWTLAAKRLRAKRRRVAAVVAVGLAILLMAAGVVWQIVRSQAAPRVLAVLPFEYQGVTEDRWRADGIADEIGDRLGEIGGVLLKARKSAKRFKATEMTDAQIGAELGVDYLLRGAIRWDGTGQGEGRVLIRPELVRVADEMALWTGRYDTVYSAILDVSANVAEHVAEALGVSLTGAEREAVQARATENLQALEYYQRGNDYAGRSSWGVDEGLPTDIRAAAEMYERAVRLDPEFAQAHARLSMQYSALAVRSSQEADSLFPLAKEHAERAIELSPGSFEGYLARAEYTLVRYSFAPGHPERVADLARAEQAAPNSPEVLDALGGHYAYVRDFERAAEYSERALQLEPLGADNAMGVGLAYFALWRHTEAEIYIDSAITLAPDKPAYYGYKSFLYLSWQGDVARARTALQNGVENAGYERLFSQFVRYDALASRILAVDEWYRSALEQLSLGPPDLDSTRYYVHKAALNEGLAHRERTRAYYDSVVALHERRGTAVEGNYGRALLARAYAGSGDEASALELARGIETSEDPQLSVGLGYAYVMLGEYELAIDEFERIIEFGRGYVTPQLLAVDPALEPLRDHPRFQALLVPDRLKGGNTVR